MSEQSKNNTESPVSAGCDAAAELKFHNRAIAHLLLIAVVGILCYSNTFNAPFQWDEPEFIENNPVVHNLGYFAHPDTAKNLKHYDALKSRYIGYLTFALNYHFNGLDVTGYHIVNLAVHIVNAVLVYFFVLLTFRTPLLTETDFVSRAKPIALFSGLLFVSHPIQTEAVTYIFQRLASLVALFYLLSVVLYIKSRQTEGRRSLVFYALSILSAVLAMKTKENAFTLPVVITLYEFCFFRGPAGRRLLYLLPLLLTMLIVPVTLSGFGNPLDGLKGIGANRTDYDQIRSAYFFTQFRVLTSYIRLLFLPFGQSIDHEYSISHSFWEYPVFLSFLFLFSAGAFSVYLLLASRTRGRYVYRFIAFGILVFFIAASPESSIIPLSMIMNEYRVYLPSLFLLPSLAASAYWAYLRLGNRRSRAGLLAFILTPLILSAVTYNRNNVWRSEFSLWEDTAAKSPNRPQAYSKLGMHFAELGDEEKGIAYFQKAFSLALDPSFAAEMLCNIGTAYDRKGLPDEALREYLAAIDIDLAFGEAYLGVGSIYFEKGDFSKADEYFMLAIKLDNANKRAHYNLGMSYLNQKRMDEARGEFETVLSIDPDFQPARQALDSIPPR